MNYDNVEPELKRKEPINLDTAIELCRQLETALAPTYHTALTGGVLYKGWSSKDVDIIVYPHDPLKAMTRAELIKLLDERAGLVLKQVTDEEYCNREVLIMNYNGLRVDIIPMT